MLTPAPKPPLLPLRDMLATAFLASGVLRRVPAGGEQAQTIDFSGVPVLPEATEPTVLSSLSTPVMEPVFVRAGTDVWGQPYAGFDFPYTTLLSFQRTKRIVKTAITGRKHTVKELISGGEWTVNIRGLLVNELSDTPPYALMADLRRLEEIEQALEVDSESLSTMKIERLVIEDLSFDFPSNFSNVQPFSMRCVADEPLPAQLRAERVARNRSRDAAQGNLSVLVN